MCILEAATPRPTPKKQNHDLLHFAKKTNMDYDVRRYL